MDRWVGALEMKPVHPRRLHFTQFSIPCSYNFPDFVVPTLHKYSVVIIVSLIPLKVIHYIHPAEHGPSLDTLGPHNRTSRTIRTLATTTNRKFDLT